ncbi:MAG TPA: DUF1848 family protein [Armatimonadota bacterium]|nr:DUF1848 family protein [Armatimonadota bacterium]
MVSPRTSTRKLKQVISASRRTELLAHYPDYLAERLRKIGPRNVHTVVVWTKDPTNLVGHEGLRAILSEVGQVLLHWTITGLGGTFLEPNVPPAQQQLALLGDVVSSVGNPGRVHWRYDPLISATSDGDQVSNVDMGLFRSLAKPIARAGVGVVHTSFVTMYRKVAGRLAKEGVGFEEYGPERRRGALAALAEAAGEVGMRLVTCCEPGLPMQRCIDGDVLTQLHPTHEPCRTDRARGQRELCGCTVSLDVGRYLPCPNGCLYCYARPAVYERRQGLRLR